MRILTLLVPALFSASSYAVKAKNPLLGQFTCEEVLDTRRPQEHAGPIEFHSSGKDDKLEDELRTDAQIITDIAHDLGLATPPHKIYFVPDEQLNVMAAMGGQPAPTWQDGHKLSTSMGSVMGVLEFVTPGCPTCRSYYSDKTTKTHQRAVLMHVMGHNDVALTSVLEHSRDIDPPADGMYLAKALESAYEKHDHDEVALFAQHLDSIKYMQDFTYGAVEKPEKFVTTPKTKATDELPWVRTPNALQALVNQLDPNAPQWKKDVLHYHERVNRVYPAYASTKVLNEGWATMQQYLIARHAPWQTTGDIVEFATLMAGVAYPSLSNPYWVGLMGWYNMYVQFTRKPAIQKLSEKDKDRAFIAWARSKYATMTDYEFLQMVIDQEFCDRWRLFIYRKTKPEEMKRGVPPAKQQLIALTRDHKRIQRYLIRRLADRSFMVPRIQFENPHLNDSGSLTFRHDLQHDLPIEPISAAKTLFVITQIFGKRAKLSAHISSEYLPQAERDWKELIMNWYRSTYPGQPIEHIADWLEARPPEFLKQYAKDLGIVQDNFYPVEVEFAVDPDGHVTIYFDEEGRRQPLEALTEIAQHRVDSYKEDVALSLHEGLSEEMRKKWTEPSMMIADKATNPAMEIVQYAPYAGQALHEYISMVEKRFPLIFKKAVATGALTPTATGVRLKVLPEIPQFSYDARFRRRKEAAKPVGRVDNPLMMSTVNWEEDDNDSNVSAGERLPGDVFPAPPPGKGSGEGEGEEGEEGDEQGEPQDNDGDNEPQPGQGQGSQNTDMEIPLSLYGKLLADELELPNLRRTEGQSVETRKVAKGTIHKPTGDLVWQAIAMRAIELGMIARKAANLPVDKVPKRTLMREGMKFITPADYVVRDKMEKPKPDFDAVVVINIDLTGSMMGERIKIAKNLVFNLRALLSAVYKNVKFHFVGFDDTAEEFPESKIWTAWRGGGTAYAPALELDEKILAQYPNSRWNKYILTIGDGETADGQRFVEVLNRLSKDLQYSGVAVVTNGSWGGYQDFLAQLEGYKGSWPWIGTTVMTSQNQIMTAIKELFPKGPVK